MASRGSFDCSEIDLDSGQLYKRGARGNLREKSFQVLASLAEFPGGAVTRQELQRHLWREDVFVDFDNNLNAAIAHLREAFSDSAERPCFIETMPGVVAVFWRAFQETPAPRYIHRLRELDWQCCLSST